MADALAVENAELRAAVESYVTACDEGIEVCMGRAPGDGGNAALERSAVAFRALRALLTADPAQHGADLLAAADRLGEAVQRWLDDPDVDATQAETDLLGDAYGEWINCRLRGGRVPEGGA